MWPVASHFCFPCFPTMMDSPSHCEPKQTPILLSSLCQAFCWSSEKSNGYGSHPGLGCSLVVEPGLGCSSAVEPGPGRSSVVEHSAETLEKHSHSHLPVGDFLDCFTECYSWFPAHLRASHTDMSPYVQREWMPGHRVLSSLWCSIPVVLEARSWIHPPHSRLRVPRPLSPSELAAKQQPDPRSLTPSPGSFTCLHR